ncbi:MAG TPA: zinc ABC transporter substrate-binding protein [Sphaerochaeta sp.]|nr:zinc ABC transporter substrate-binding protein [Sphaerochaeta sp.]
MKKMLAVLLFLTLSVALFAQGAPEQLSMSSASRTISVIASTSWTAAFADLGGAEKVEVIAPASLIHPPEYEITVSDVLKIDKADYFIYAGYERMMQSMGDAIGKTNTDLVKINTDNSIENVKTQAALIASALKSQYYSEDRVFEYVETIQNGKQAVEKKGLDKQKVYCHAMQIYLAKDLGLEVGGTFGPGPLTANQIAEVAKGGYDIIIDNVHNPIASPLMEVSPKTKLVVWRNFPEAVERASLQKMVQENIDALLK